jgi:SAM-dependent methyltransferase
VTREPTTHERLAGRPWEESYTSGGAPWDIGRPQPAIVRLAAQGAFRCEVLDAGCGTGENALHVAALGVRVLGVDVAPTAIALAREKAQRRGLDAEFAVMDALALERLDRRFDTVLDCGLFHAFDAAERRRYAASLAAAARPGAGLHVLCFRDAGPASRGPHPVTEAQLRAPLEAAGWRVAGLVPERVHSRFAPDGSPAWLARAELAQPGFGSARSRGKSPAR